MPAAAEAAAAAGDVGDSNQGSLSSVEQQMYDRQIRLWGLQAQQRLRSASVIILGDTHFAAEVGTIRPENPIHQPTCSHNRIATH